MDSVKISNLVKKYVCNEWCPQVAKYKKERTLIQRDIAEHLQSYELEMLYNFGPIKRILVNLNGKCYIVDFEKYNVYINDDVHNIKQYLIPKFLIKEERLWDFRTNEASFYKNYTNDYEDIRTVIEIVSEYLINLRSMKAKNPWNVSEKIKEAVDYIKSFSYHTDYSSNFYYISNNVGDSCLFLNSNDVLNYNNNENNYYERFELDAINIDYFLDNFDFEFCNDILVLSKNLYNKTYDSKEMYVLKKLTSFLKYFDINKKVFPIMNEEDGEKRVYKNIYFFQPPDKQEKQIKALLKRVDPELLNLVNTKLRQSNHNYEKFKNSLHLDFSEADVAKLFYNPRLFHISLPENFSFYGYKVSVYVANHMFDAKDIQERKIDTKDIDDAENIDYENALRKIEIRFCFENEFKDKWSFSMSLDTYLSELNNVRRFNKLIRHIYRDSQNFSLEVREKRLVREYLRSFIIANNLQLLRLILDKMNDHVNMGKVHVKQSDIKLSDIVTHTEDYFDNCIKY